MSSLKQRARGRGNLNDANLYCLSFGSQRQWRTPMNPTCLLNGFARQAPSSRKWSTLPTAKFNAVSLERASPSPSRAESRNGHDRPDVTESSSTVGSGVLQIEAGYTYLQDCTAGQLNQSHSFPEVLLRYGTPADWLELRFATNISHQKAETTSFTGTEDLYFGAKLGLTLQEGLYPEMALVPQMTIPSGSGTLTAGKLLPVSIGSTAGISMMLSAQLEAPSLTSPSMKKAGRTTPSGPKRGQWALRCTTRLEHTPSGLPSYHMLLTLPGQSITQTAD